MLSVVLPACNEEAQIEGCLRALFEGRPPAIPAEAIVVANGCTDGTAAAARGLADLAARRGWRMAVLDLDRGGKTLALNAGDRAAQPGSARIYLDADVRVSPGLVAALAPVLAVPGPVYATGTAVLPRAASAVTRAYARFWQRLPFARSVAPGFGLFAMSAAGRARWGDWPEIISDDTFARLHFAPGERVQLPDTYAWPMAEGFRALVRVRRRQDAGVAQIARLWPDLPARDGRPPLSARDLAGLALADPAGCLAYAAVSLAVRAGRSRGWERGR